MFVCCLVPLPAVEQPTHAALSHFFHAFQFLLSPVSLPFSLVAHSTRLASLEALQCKFNIKINNLNKTFRTLVVFDKQINALVRLRFNNC
jgi:hypothetical protein